MGVRGHSAREKIEIYYCLASRFTQFDGEEQVLSNRNRFCLLRGHSAREKMGKDVFPDDARWENMFSQMRCFPR